MEHSDHLKIILEQNHKDQDIKRKFDPSFQNTIFGTGLKSLSTKRRQLKAAFPMSMAPLINKVLKTDLELFLKPQDMPWYLDLIAQRIIDERGIYKIHFKSCRDFTYLDVSIRD